MSKPANRMPLIDALKAIAALLVLLNHFSSYGPLAEAARDAFPAISGWIFEYCRMAVQVFLVIAGFLAARGLSAEGQALSVSPLPLIWKRYLRLAVPYLAAIGLAIIASAIANQWLDDEAIPARATFVQWLAHAALLHSLLGFDSLSAGVWYIAIDFQLFVLLLGTLWFARAVGDRFISLPVFSILFVSVLALGSLFYFNRDSDWDNWAIYFFAAYALGTLTYWVTESERNPDWLPVIFCVVVVALIIDFRSRIAVALITALALGISRRWGFMESRPGGKFLAYLGKISYSVFLVHFPVLLVMNALFSRIAPEDPTANAFGIGLAWAASVAAGAVFYRFVESQARRWQGPTLPRKHQSLHVQ